MIEGHLSLTFVMIYIAEVVVRFAKRVFVAFLGEETNLVRGSGFRSVESIILKQQPIASCLSQRAPEPIEHFQCFLRLPYPFPAES